jgi:hypothetical protein
MGFHPRIDGCITVLSSVEPQQFRRLHGTQFITQEPWSSLCSGTESSSPATALVHFQVGSKRTPQGPLNADRTRCSSNRKPRGSRARLVTLTPHSAVPKIRQGYPIHLPVQD